MKYLIFISLILVTISSSLSQQGWVQQTSGTNNNINYIQFLDANTGFVCGNNGVILKTTNGGSGWFVISTLTADLRCVQFLNQSTGFVSSDSVKYVTVNGGATWSIVGNTKMSPKFHFVSLDTGFSFSNYYWKFFEKTFNGGSHWDSSNVGIGNISDIIFVNKDTIYLPGSDLIMQFGGIWSSSIIRVTNRGSIFSEVYAGPLGYFVQGVFDLSFPLSKFGFGVGADGSVPYFYKSTNFGNNWTRFQLPFYGGSAICFADSVNGWILSLYNICYTTNAGASFVYQSNPSQQLLNRIYMLNMQTGWIVGNMGTIMKTTNGGLTGFQIENHEVPNDFSLFQNYPNPFNPKTVIKFQVASEKFVKLVVYDALGKEVETLVNQQLTPGTYQADWDGTNFPSGVYFYQLSSGEELIATRKMALMK